MIVTATAPAAATGLSNDARRIVVYAVSNVHRSLDDYVSVALAGIRPIADRLIVIVCGERGGDVRSQLEALSDSVIVHTADFESNLYARAIERAGGDLADFDELVLTGDSWFGPTADFTAVLQRMARQPVHFWEMVENRQGVPRAFPDQGFPARLETWAWTVARRDVFLSDDWHSYWAARRSVGEALAQETGFGAHFRASGFEGAFAFAAEEFSNDDPALFTPDLLIAAGCPFVKRLAFTLYPPYLHQHAVIGRDVLASIEETGFSLAPLWQNLARTVPPKALNTNATMLEVLGSDASSPRPEPRRLAAVAYVGDVDQAEDLFRRLASLPVGYDLIVTTSDGRRAAALTKLLNRSQTLGFSTVDVRVTPANPGRDMSDFFIACRDVLAPGRYDLVVKVHARPMRRKTSNVRRYFRRYQLDNLLASPEHVAEILNLFDREPGLGLVFPPMIHIGYATMGRGWGDYREAALRLLEQLGISVPVDRISPLAPYGAMWFARPESLRLLSQERWLYRDYGKPGRQRYRMLARLQERTVVYAAAELGFHSRTVLTAEHAAISHTALEFKVDQLFSTTRGYPVDQIQLVQRAGQTGYGGIIGLSRMYLRLNHPSLARIVLPVLAGAQWVYSSTRALMGDERFMKPRDTWRDEDL